MLSDLLALGSALSVGLEEADRRQWELGCGEATLWSGRELVDGSWPFPHMALHCSHSSWLSQTRKEIGFRSDCQPCTPALPSRWSWGDNFFPLEASVCLSLKRLARAAVLDVRRLRCIKAGSQLLLLGLEMDA